MIRSKTKTFLISFFLVAIAVCFSVALTACKGGDKDKDSGKYGYGEEGFYYYDGADSARYMLSLQSGSYMISVNNDTAYSGSYSYDEESGTVSFKGAEEFTAKFGEDALSLTVDGSGYSFKAYKFFDVTYVDETGKTVATDSVLNGQSAAYISGDGLKEGYWFIDWYADSAISSVYAFDTSVAGNVTIYGWFIEKNASATEHTVTLDYGDGATETWTTTNGAIYKELPSAYEGNAIIGWWVSATNRGDELSYRYAAGETFDADTTLFAVYSSSSVLASSVTSDGVTWETANAGTNVTVTVYDDSGREVLYGTATSSSGAYTSSAFASLDTGVYTVVVSSGNISETRLYVVHGLARVSLTAADVVVNGNGRVLSFAAVDGADGYIIAVTNGEKTVTEDLGNHTYYNFSDWEMTKEGITFVVTAYGEGYADSVSNEFTYLLVLANVTITIDGDVVSWNGVDGALGYEVTVTKGDEVVDSFTTSGTSFSLKYYENGTYDITVQPKTSGYYSEPSGYYGYAKDALAAPHITDVTDYTVSWSEVEGATSYVVLINGAEYEVTSGTTLAFADSNVPTYADSYEISVKAVGENGNDSPYSDVVSATAHEFNSSVSYDKNTVTWHYDIAATAYGISVNGGAETLVENGNSSKVTLTRAGDNTVTVTAYSGAETMGYAEMTVYAYAVTLDPNGATPAGNAIGGVVYVARGDELDLGTVEKENAVFVGWYTQADYTEGQSDEYEGKGSLVEDGSTFTGSSSMYLYAYWTYEYVDVVLYVENEQFATTKIKYNSTSFVIDTPDAPSETQDFAGWYTEGGTEYATETGASNGLRYAGDTALYARFLTTRTYTSTRYNGETVYSVKTTEDASSMKEMTIPEGYTTGGKTYDIVIQNNAFATCTNLEVLNIPDSVLYIAVTNSGYSSGSGAFSGLKSIKEVNIYVTGDEPDSSKEVNYFSADGVLFDKITMSDDAEILYYPYGKTTDSYSMPTTVSNGNECEWDGTPITHKVSYVPSQVFRYAKATEITVSNTVTEVGANAFYLNGNVRRIYFEAGGTEPLTIGNYAFRKCTNLTEITLPARFSSLSYRTFYGASALVNVYVEAGGTYSSDSGVLLADNGATLIYYPEARKGYVDLNTVTTGSITKIGAYAFANNTNVTGVTISAAVTEIGEGAFQACTRLAEVVFQGNENSAHLAIRENAFYGCTLLSSVSLPANLTVMEKNAFGNCTRLMSVYFDSFQGATSADIDFAADSFGADSYVYTIEFGANVPEFEFAAVFGSSRLETIIIDPNNKAYYADEESVVYNAQKTTLMFVPLTVAGEFTVLDTVTNIAADVFVDRVNITKISMGAMVNTIPDGAFDGCTFLTAIEVNENNTNFASIDGVLYKLEEGVPVTLVYCPMANAVTKLYVPTTVTYVATRAFANNTTVTSVSFVADEDDPDAEEDTRTSFELAERVFYHSSSSTVLTTVVLPDCMTKIPAYTFYNCRGLATVNIPASVTEIEEYAFYYCSPLLGDQSAGKNETGSYITLPEGLVSIGQYAFYYCQKLAVTIPATVETIDYRAFYYCWYDSTNGKAPLVFASVADENGKTPSNAAQSLYIADQAFYYSRYVDGDVVIPANVTYIGNNAFYYMSYSQKTVNLSFEEGFSLTAIPEKAFYSAGLKSITIPACVETIESDAFRVTSSTLTEINFAENGKLSRIESNAFYNAAMTSIEIPASVDYIGSNAFYGAKFADQEEEGAAEKIDGVTFEERNGTPIEIASSAFASSAMTHFTCPEGLVVFNQIFGTNVKNLKEITFSSTVNEIGSSAFSGATFTTFEVPAQIEVIGDKAFASCQKLESVTFEEGSHLARIGDSVFYFCPLLTSFSFPESTSEIELGSSIFQSETGYGLHDDPDSAYGESIGEYVNPTPVTTVYISTSIREIGAAFVDAYYLESFTIAENHPTLELTADGTVIYSKTKDAIVYVIDGTESVDFSNTSITTIKSYAFDSSESLKSVTLSANITSIEEYAFRYCTSLETVKFAEGTDPSIKLGEGVFYRCESLTSVNLPEGITEIPAYFFSGCMSLMEVEIPATVKTIGDYAFNGTGNLQLNDITETDDDRYTGVTEFEAELTIDASNVTYFGTGAFQKSGIVSITLGKDGSAITFGNSVFREAAWIEEVELPYGMTSIPGYFFEDAASVTYIGIPDTVVEIGIEAFSGCASLVDLEIPDSVTTMGARLFMNCSSLKSVKLPDDTTTITQQFFEYSGIETFTLPETVTYIEQDAFKYCYQLESIDFNHCFVEMDVAIFTDDSNLAYLENYENLLNVSYGAFSGCGLTEFHGGEYLTILENDAFYNNKKLETVSFEPGLTTISYRAFSGCSALTSCDLPKGLEVIGSNSMGQSGTGSAFANCTAMEYFYIPSTVVMVGSSNFMNYEGKIFIENTKNFVTANWTSGWGSSKSTVTYYYYTATEPTTFTEDGTAYDDNYWYFDYNDNICVWEYTPDVYTVSDDCYIEANTTLGIILGIYVLDEDSGEFASVTFIQDADSADSCVVVFGEGDDAVSYTVELDSETMTATLTEVTKC